MNSINDSRPLDVGILTAHLSFDHRGGSNYSIHRLASELEARGHGVTVYTINREQENHVPVAHGYDVVEDIIQCDSVVGGSRDLIDQLPHCIEPNDVFHVYIPGVIPLVGLYRWRADDETPIVATLNGYTTFCTNTAVMANGCWNDCTLAKKFSHARERGVERLQRFPRMAFNDLAGPRLMNQLDEFFCLSPAVRDIHEGIGIDEHRLTVIPNMLDTTFQTTDPIETDEPRVLYVGRLEDMKGIGILLDAIARTSTANYHVDIVGDNLLNYGPDLSAYRQRAADLDIRERVSFHGWVDYTDLSRYYASADVFVHPGLWPEPFGRTILEAMQHDIPVVCSDVGGPPWICGDAGLTYPRKDAGALADILDELVTDIDRREALAANAPTELERFDPDRVVDTIVRRYRRQLAFTTGNDMSE